MAVVMAALVTQGVVMVVRGGGRGDSDCWGGRGGDVGLVLPGNGGDAGDEDDMLTRLSSRLDCELILGGKWVLSWCALWS